MQCAHYVGSIRANNTGGDVHWLIDQGLESYREPDCTGARAGQPPRAVNSPRQASLADVDFVTLGFVEPSYN
jgi:hypothetical protein